MKVGDVLRDWIKALYFANAKIGNPAMPKRLTQLEGKSLFDIASCARPGSPRRDRLSPEKVEQIALTVRRGPVSHGQGRDSRPEYKKHVSKRAE